MASRRLQSGKLGDRKSRKALGQWGEEQAIRYLQSQGFHIIARNYRYGRQGEIDIVAKDGECWVFVEVKTRRSRQFGAPEESITLAKQTQLRKLAVAFLVEQGIEDAECRFDVISIELRYGTVQIRHLRNAF